MGLSNKLGEVMLNIRTSRPDLLTGIDLDRFDKVRDLMHSKLGGTEKNYTTRELIDMNEEIMNLGERLLKVRVTEPVLMTGVDLDDFDKIRSFINLQGKIRTSLTENTQNK